jgi:hypothetical protein
LADAGLAADVSHRHAIGAPRVIKFIGYLGPPKRRFDQKNAAYYELYKSGAGGSCGGLSELAIIGYD